MNFFEEAVSAHMQWKQKLRAIVDGREAPLEADTASSDCNCELGKWIHGEAANLMTKAQTGDRAGALQSLNGGEFQVASSRTVLAIGNLRHELETNKPQTNCEGQDSF